MHVIKYIQLEKQVRFIAIDYYYASQPAITLFN